MDKKPSISGLSADKLADLWNIGSDAEACGEHHQDLTDGAKPEINDYKIMDQLGQGAMGTVWNAVQVSTQRKVALKVLSAKTFGSQKVLARFEREIELAARLEHPNIARMYDSGLHQGMYFYTMELLEGRHLDEYLKEQQLSQRKTLGLFLSICQAVQHAHQRGVIHRDLKPSNIIITDDGQPHILDFGLAKASFQNEHDQTVSVDGELYGTPAYMSPEQAAGKIDKIDTRSDVYSLSVILYDALLNQNPIDLTVSRYEVLKNIQETDPIRPRTISPDFDADLEAILLKALSKNPDLRYQSVSGFATDLQKWIENKPVSARPITRLYLLQKFMVRNKTFSTVAILLLVFILIASFISLYSYGRLQKALETAQLKQEVYRVQTKKVTTFANQVAFASFLELWHNNEVARASGFVIHLNRKSRERTAAKFLLSPEPFIEKSAKLRKELTVSQNSFYAFVVGEYYLKNNKQADAIKAFKDCLDKSDGDSELNDWFRNRSKRKLNELNGEKLSSDTYSGISCDK